MVIHTALEKFYQEDKQDRQLWETGELTDDQIKKNDESRLKKVKKLLDQQKIDLDEIWNCHYLCLLFMHSWSNNPKHYRIAHEFAKRAINLGSNVTKWLYAASLDRWLISQGKPQKFGTQYNLQTGKIAPYDLHTPDSERRKYGVPPLSNLLKR